MAELCSLKAGDYSTLLLLYSALNDADKLHNLYQLTSILFCWISVLVDANQLAIAYQCAVLMGDHDAAIQTLIKGDRVVDAAFYARNYHPQAIDQCVRLWKAKLLASQNAQHRKFADRVADPLNHPNLFPSINKVIW